MRSECLDKIIIVNGKHEGLVQGRPVLGGIINNYLWASSPQNIPIPGFRTVPQVEENKAAMAHGPLTPVQMEEIDALL